MSGTLTLESVCKDEEELTSLTSTEECEECEEVEEGCWMEMTGEGAVWMGTSVTGVESGELSIMELEELEYRPDPLLPPPLPTLPPLEEDEEEEGGRQCSAY